ncbi:MAG: methyltransferase domain-containing protein [Loktanella sp.]|nr:methyltransferase domain-containing protein [Loktanella sp.]
MSAPANWSLREDIRAYWEQRAQTFDLSPGHGTDDPVEIALWADLLRDLGLVPGMRVLEPACGTGAFTTALLAAGAEVEGIDFTHAMLARAQARHGTRARFRLAAAETPMVVPGYFDAIATRHLVWTLTAPATTFAAWAKALRPGGLLIIIDGDWRRQTALSRLATKLGQGWDRRAARVPLWDDAANTAIMDRLPFGDGLRAEKLAGLLQEAGFSAPRFAALGPIRWRQLRQAGWRDRLALLQTAALPFAMVVRRL